MNNVCGNLLTLLAAFVMRRFVRPKLSPPMYKMIGYWTLSLASSPGAVFSGAGADLVLGAV